MRIAVLGLGYVGAVASACLARDGHTVWGVDVNPDKVALMRRGNSPIVEEGLDSLVREGVQSGGLRLTTDLGEALAHTDICFVCVGTPSRDNGDLDLTYVLRVSEQIGSEIRRRAEHLWVVMRSTVLPGTGRATVVPAIERASGKRRGAAFSYLSNPEFLREGTAITDYDNPSKTLVGTIDGAEHTPLHDIYSHLKAPVICTDLETAELAKYADNAWHALKVSFANEIGSVARRVGIDGRQVMDIFCRDTKLNISRAYLRPGSAFGGSCLPKDVRALSYQARALDLHLPVLSSIMESNAQHIARAVRLITRREKGRLAILGLSFKGATDDLRESPMVQIVEFLIGKGYEMRIFDPNVSLARIVGANKAYIETHIPHIAALFADSLAEAVEGAKTIVIGNDDPAFRDVAEDAADGQTVVDLAGTVSGQFGKDGYVGVCW